MNNNILISPFTIYNIQHIIKINRKGELKNVYDLKFKEK